MTTCQHKTVFWDEDEWRCRTCSQSLSFPARPPGPEDVKNQKRDTRIASGDKRRKHTPVVEVQEVQASPSAPLLLCHCCQKMLPQNDFYRNNHPAGGESELPRPEVPGVYRLPAQGQAAAKPGRRKAERPGTARTVHRSIDPDIAGVRQAAPRSGGERGGERGGANATPCAAGRKGGSEAAAGAAIAPH